MTTTSILPSASAQPQSSASYPAYSYKRGSASILSSPSAQAQQQRSVKKRRGQDSGASGSSCISPFGHDMSSISTHQQLLQQLFQQIGDITGDFDPHESETIQLKGNLTTNNESRYIGVYPGDKKETVWRMRYRDDSGNLTDGGYYYFQPQAAAAYDAVKINEIIENRKKKSVLHLNFKPFDDQIKELRKKGIKVIRYIYEHI
jgi:hypothetical protein